MPGSRILALIIVFSLPCCSTVVAVEPELLSRQQRAAEALKGVASNLQLNRDGTVRFVRFSRSAVTDEHLVHLQAFEQLDYLAVVTPTVSDDGLRWISHLSNLDTLLLSDSGLTDAGMSAVGGLERLERLYLDRTRVGDTGLAHLARLSQLKTLSVRGTNITDAGLKQLSHLTHLEALFLTDTGITDAGLKALGEFRELRTLHLDRTSIQGSGLRHLALLDKLEELSLSGLSADHLPLAALANNGALRRLLLYDTSVDAAALSQLRTQLPDCAIYPNPGLVHERTALDRLLAGEPLLGPTGNTTELPQATDAPETASIPPVRERYTELTGAVPDFQQHVIPLLGRLGCNGRTCHGSFQGQAGFRLSMFGYDFETDLAALTGGEVPRADVDYPADSLILLKPTMQDEHGGGKRFEQNGWEHHLLLRWITGGAPGVTGMPKKLERFEVTPREIVFTRAGDEVQLQCLAVWSDGFREDVTCLTRFQTKDDAVATVTADGLVRCQSPGDTYVISYYDNGISSTQVLLPVTKPDREFLDRLAGVPTPTRIDELVVEKLAKLGILPSALCSDESFLRRATLDIAGSLPTPGEVSAFVADRRPDKRRRKIDELLDSPAYVQWWTVQLSDLTGSNSQYLGTTDMNRTAADQWNAWLRRRLLDNDGWDRIAAGMILAVSRRPGQMYEEYAAQQSQFVRTTDPEDFTAADNPMHYYWFRSNNQLAADRALSFGYVFLGVRLQCAQCHKHPFDQWSQQDFEKFTQFFSRIQAGIAPDAQQTQQQLKTRLGVPSKLNTAALRRQMYQRVSAEGLPIPWNEVWIDSPPEDQPQVAKLLGDEELTLNDYDDPREPLMQWLLRDNNPYFAPAFVNRIWAYYFGVGIVEPPDDFSMANPPSNKRLLDWLSTEFVRHGYDTKWLHRTITNSRTYQLGWQPNESNRTDERNFSHAKLRRLPAEVAIDAVLQATANDAGAADWIRDVEGRKIAQHPISIQARGIDYSLLVFGKPLRTTNCDCERQLQPTLLQSLFVRNDHELLAWLERRDGWLMQIAQARGETLLPETAQTAVVPAKLTSVATASNETASQGEPLPSLESLVHSAYLRTLSRKPTVSELQRAVQHLEASDVRVEALRDLLWALLNTQEFMTNH